MSNINLAEGIAEETEKINSSFSQVMKLAIDLKNKCDGIQRLADRRRKSMERLNSEIFELKKERIELRSQREELAKVAHPLLEKNKKEVDSIPTEDLKSALVLALCQRDVAFRSVPKVQEISKLLTAWDQGFINDYENFIATCDVGTISDFDVIRHIIDVILKPKKDI